MYRNERIEAAIDAYYASSDKEHLIAVLESIRQRMHEDGHFMIPVLSSGNGMEFSVRTVRTGDGREWPAAFTSSAEYEKGQPSEILSNFIDSSLRACLDTKSPGLLLNPWGRSFMLTKELIDLIFQADGGVEYAVPDDALTPELLEDGSYLKRAVDICSRNRTQLNIVKLMKILRNSRVWVPCTAVLSDADQAAVEKLLKEALENGGQGSPARDTLVTRDDIRMVPDILQKGEEYFFPVFTTAEEMGEYGERFSAVQSHFPEVVKLARNNEKKVAGIVIDAFSGPFIVPMDLADIIEEMPSAFEEREDADKEDRKRRKR